MLADPRYVGVLAVLLGATTVTGIFHISGPGPSVEETVDADGAYNLTEDGTKYIVHPDDLVQGCPGMDCIPSIDDSSFVTGEEADAWLADGDVVIGVEIGDETTAYPLRILERHEIVNDVVGGEPVAVTYCPLCRSGVVHSRELDGRNLTFGVSGKLRDANLVMYDRQTETYWSQIGGRAIIGSLVPARLELLHASVVRWEDWHRGHPGTQVLSRETGIYSASSYDELLYKRYHQRPSVGFGVEEPSGELPTKEIVYGIEVGEDTKAYPEVLVRNRTIINDAVGETPVVVFISPVDGSVVAFERQVDGRTLSFELHNGTLRDQDGDRWFLDGEVLKGLEEGTGLERFRTDAFYWFAWEKFNEATSVYRGE